MNAYRASRRFDMSDQARFAGFSGDANPMHMDPLAARRTQAGAPVVHGIHAVLWALDSLTEAGRIAAPITTLRVQFQKFIYVGAEVTLCLVRENQAELRAEIRGDGLTITTLTVGFAPPVVEKGDSLPAYPEVPASVPRVLDFSEVADCLGTLPLSDEKSSPSLFPHAGRVLGMRRVLAIMALSRLVGMVCPGLHSIFSGFDIAMPREDLKLPGLRFHVGRVDDRFRMLEMDIDGEGIRGMVTAFVRPSPTTQPSMREVGALVKEGEFSGITALIVGGSRGLGALSAKLIVAGGGRVIVTYVVGDAQARELAAECGSDVCKVTRYDAREAAAPQFAGLAWPINQLYYFATPRIFRQKANWYVRAHFVEFCSIYVDGFEEICAALRAREEGALSVFYPSSSAVENRPRDMTEYAMAKAAGEQLCADINRFSRGMRVLVKRLPRVATDQTATVMPVEVNDASAVMVPIVREMALDLVADERRFG